MELYLDKADSGDRIDSFLSLQIEELSRSRIQKLIKDELVLVNGKSVKTSYKLNEGDVVSVDIPKNPAEVGIVPEDIPLDIIYEDDDILIVNKPKGMVVHPAPGHYTGTLVNAIMYHCKDSLSGINGELRPGIVHRIDRDTTGSLIICKNDNAHRFIANQIAEHSCNREYVGIVNGHLTNEKDVIDSPIGRNPKDRKKMAIVPDGRNAVTHYEILQVFRQYDFVKFKLETGRTHQIRVHMASINHPLLGDEVYGPSKCPFKLQGQTLHAKTIGFIHPTTKEYMEFEAPLPAYFEDLIKKLSVL